MGNIENYAKYQSVSLFLLIGTNPLPNYVAYKLLAKPSCHVYFVHTNETDQVADRLVNVLNLPDGIWTKIHVDGYNADNIYTEIYKYAKGKEGLGLNYTGGTKSMAVHSYRAIQGAEPNAIFSYLDGRRLKLLIDKRETSSIELAVGLSVKPTIETLLALHGHTQKEPEVESFQPDVCRELINIPRDDLRNWCDHNLRSGLHTKIMSPQKLKDVRLPVDHPFDSLEQYWGNCITIEDLAIMWDKDVKYLGQWFDGKWLEHYTLWALQQVANASNIHTAVLSLKSKERGFELDVAALRGYQLFAISCTTDASKGMIKLKLFEAYVRAHQLGGDEAKIGMVCLASNNNSDSNPAMIKKEIEEEWEVKDKFRVFGIEDLPDLSAYLQEWFNAGN